MYWAHGVALDVLIEAHDLVQHPNKNRIPYLTSNPLKRADFRSVTREACSAGTIVHEYVERWIKTPKPSQKIFFERVSLRSIICEYNIPKPTGLAAYNGIQAFRKWVQQHNFELVQTEVPLVSQKHKYGGTLDCIGRFEDDLILFDWKTSSGVYYDYLAQIAAYNMLWEENHPGEENKIQSSHLLRFDKPTGDPSHHQFTELEDAKRLFILYRECYDLVKKLEKRLK